MNLALSKRNDFCKLRIEEPAVLTRMFDELMSRDHEGGRPTG